MENKKLLIHFNQLQNILTEFSKLIDNAEHPVNLGSAREALISNFLSSNLSELISFHTGEIFDTFDHYSGQIDIVLHPKSSPKLNLFGAINLFPLETVLAAIEVKSSLNTDKLPFFQKYIYNKCELTKIELINQYKIIKDKDINKLKKIKSSSSLAGALETSFKVKRLISCKNNEKVPFILFVYNYTGSLNNITDKIGNWIVELKNQYSKIFFSLDTINKLNSINELKDKFQSFNGKIFIDENDFLNSIKKHFKDETLFPKNNDLYNQYIELISKNVKTEKFKIADIINFLPDRILILNHKNNNLIQHCLLKIKLKASMNVKHNEHYDIQTENILYELFSYINKISENWFTNKENHYFPALEYTSNFKVENYIRANDLFKF